VFEEPWIDAPGVVGMAAGEHTQTISHHELIQADAAAPVVQRLVSSYKPLQGGAGKIAAIEAQEAISQPLAGDDDDHDQEANSNHNHQGVVGVQHRDKLDDGTVGHFGIRVQNIGRD